MASDMNLRRPTCERRRYARFPIESWFPDLVVRVRPGVPASVREVSTGGCVIDTNRSLLPGARVELAVASSFGRLLVRGRVLRCHVGHISASVVTFAAALQFDDGVDWQQLVPALSWLEAEAELIDTSGHQLPGSARPRVGSGTEKP